MTAEAIKTSMTVKEEQEVQDLINFLLGKDIPPLDNEELNTYLDGVELNETETHTFEHLAYKELLILDLNESRRRFGLKEHKVGREEPITPSLFDLLYSIELKKVFSENGNLQTFP